jgi:hypothetical protein
MKLKFSWQFFENAQISNFMTIRSVEAELFHADRRMYTDMKKLILAFRNFAKAPNKDNNIWQALFFLHLRGNKVLFVTN